MLYLRILCLCVRLFVINTNVPNDWNRHSRVRNAQMLASGSECQREMRSLGRQPVISEVQFSESGGDLFYKWLIKTMRDEVSPRDWHFVFIYCVIAISKHFAFPYIQFGVHVCSWSCDSIYRCRLNNNEILKIRG